MSKRAILFITSTAIVGMLVVAHSVWFWNSSNLTRFFCYLLEERDVGGYRIRREKAG